jgi:hypothetical protein
MNTVCGSQLYRIAGRDKGTDLFWLKNQSVPFLLSVRTAPGSRGMFLTLSIRVVLSGIWMGRPESPQIY